MSLPLLNAGSGGAGGGASSLLTSLAGYYNMNEDPASDAVDSLGTNNLENNGTVGSAAGKVDTARTFGTDNFLSAASAGVFDYAPGSSFTIAFWAFPTAGTAFGMAVTKNNRFDIRQNGAGTGWEFTNTGASGPVLTGGVDLNAWQLLVCRYNSVAGTFSISKNNGAATDSVTLAPEAGATVTFQVGARSGANFFVGRVDELGIWSRVLTAPEEATLWNSGNGTTYPF